MIKRFLSILTTASLLLAAAQIFNINANKKFDDITSDQWYYNYVMNLTAKNIITGYPDNTFKADKNVTNGEFAKMLATSLGTDKEINQYAKDNTDWSYKYIRFCQKHGVNTLELNEKNANKAITKEMAIRFLVMAQGIKIEPDSTLIVNTKINDYDEISHDGKYPTVRDCVSTGYVYGYCAGNENHRIEPKKNITRAEVSALLYKVFFETLPKPDINKWQKTLPLKKSDMHNLKNCYASQIYDGINDIPKYLIELFNETGWSFIIDNQRNKNIGNHYEGYVNFDKKELHIYCGSDSSNNLKYVVFHEFGHVAHYINNVNGLIKDDKYADYHTDMLYRNESFKVKELYGNEKNCCTQNSKELFAEAFAWILQHKGDQKALDKFKATAPQTYEYVYEIVFE